MGINGLSRYPLLTFGMACVAICFIIMMHRKKFPIKSVIVLFYLGTIANLGITIARLNHKYFILSSRMEILLNIVIFGSGAIMIVLIFYISYKLNKHSYGKLPPMK